MKTIFVMKTFLMILNKQVKIIEIRMKALNILIQKIQKFIRTFRISLTRLLLWSWDQEDQDVLLFIDNIFRITQICFLSF